MAAPPFALRARRCAPRATLHFHLAVPRTSATSYAIRGGEEGKRRLDLIGKLLAPSTEELLRRAGVGPGQHALDLGCGGGHVTLAVARLVGPSGSVVGVDVDDVKLDLARQDAERLGMPNVGFRRENVLEWREEDTYDVVSARFLLSHLANRQLLLGRMMDALRPGGVCVVEDIDLAGLFCYPPSAAFTKYGTLYHEVVRRRGGDADLGPKLHGMFRDAGFEHLGVRVIQPVHTAWDDGKELTLSTLENIADAVLAERLVSPDELSATLAGLAAVAHDSTTLVSLPRIFGVWGRKPGAPARS